MIDFNKGLIKPYNYAGSERKLAIEVDGTLYMIKFPDPIRETKRKDLLSYKNNQFSEHIGSHIFQSS